MAGHEFFEPADRKRPVADPTAAEPQAAEEPRHSCDPAFKHGVVVGFDGSTSSERALAYADTAPASILTGTRVIHQRLQDLLQAQGVVPYTSAGQPFDPALHEAVDVINTDQAAPGVVLHELSHGYRWGDEVLRPARVRVAQ